MTKQTTDVSSPSPPLSATSPNSPRQPNPNTQTPKFILTVRLITGERVEHVYDIPSDFKEAMELVHFVGDMVAKAMTRGRNILLYLENPGISYNPDNVVGVEFKTIEAKELEKEMRKAQKMAMGFLKD